MRIALIRPVYQTGAYDPEIQEPLGIEALAGFIRSYGHEVQLLDPLLTGHTERYAARQATAYRPNLVGFSLMSMGDLDSAIRMMAQIRSAHPDIVFAAGGNLISTEPEVVLTRLPAGTVCSRYEGERPWLGMVEAISQKCSLEAVGSLLFRDEAGHLTCTPIQPPIDDLDSLPFPARDLISATVARDLAINLQGSRGCLGTCRYCCAPGFPRASAGRWRGRSPGHIAEEIHVIVENHHAAVFNFVDDDFLGPERAASKRASDLRAEIHRRGLPISFGIQARPSTLSRETIHQLAAAGLSYVFFGFESDDEDALRSWGRKAVPFNLPDLVRTLREYDIEPQAGCIPFHPDSTLASLRRLAEILWANGLLNYRTATNRLQLLPGSQMHHQLQQAGKLDLLSPGPCFPPITDPATARFYETLIAALQPLRPVWVYAASRFPAVKGYHRIHLNAYAQRYQAIRQALTVMDTQIGVIFFHLLTCFEAGDWDDTDLEQLRRSNFDTSMVANRLLAENGLVEDADILRSAIREDSGL